MGQYLCGRSLIEPLMPSFVPVSSAGCCACQELVSFLLGSVLGGSDGVILCCRSVAAGDKVVGANDDIVNLESPLGVLHGGASLLTMPSPGCNLAAGFTCKSDMTVDFMSCCGTTGSHYLLLSS